MLTLAVTALCLAAAPAVNVRDFGATGDGKAKDHAAIQRAVDACAAHGGGTVYVPAGAYLCGTVELKSHTRLYLDAGATIVGSPDRDDYRKVLAGDFYNVGNPRQPHNRDQGLIVARNATAVGIAGPGTIDARGHQFYDQTKPNALGKFAVGPWRPGPTVLLIDCADVRLSDFRLLDSPFFAVNLVGCTTVRVTDLRVRNDVRFQNGDGLHVTCCRGVTVSGCHIDTEDDALCFFTHHDGVTAGPSDCTDIAVSNCVLRTSWTGVRIGYAGDGQLRNLAFTNLVVSKCFAGIDFICTAKNTYKGEASTAGPSIRDIVFSNVVVADAEFGVSANVLPDAKPPGGLRDVLFTGMKVRSRRGNYLAGRPGLPVGGVTFRDSDFTVTGDVKQPPTPPDPLPVFASRLRLPHGFLLQHAEGVAFRDCRIRWDGAAGDWGSALHVIDGRDIDVRTLRADPFRPGEPAVTGRTEGGSIQ